METWHLEWSNLIGLTADNINALDQTTEGVYRLSKLEAGKAFIFYVGQGRIRDRLLHHVSEEEENSCIKSTVRSFSCYFKFAIITNAEVRKAAERKLYGMYLPSCNEVEPGGRDDIEVNLE